MVGLQLQTLTPGWQLDLRSILLSLAELLGVHSAPLKFRGREIWEEFIHRICTFSSLLLSFLRVFPHFPAAVDAPNSTLWLLSPENLPVFYLSISWLNTARTMACPQQEAEKRNILCHSLGPSVDPPSRICLHSTAF